MVFPKRVRQVWVQCWILTHHRTLHARAAVLRVLTGLLLSLLFLFKTKFFSFSLNFSHYFFAKLFVSHGDQSKYGYVSHATFHHHHHHNSMHISQTT
jgi:hypothetical protein